MFFEDDRWISLKEVFDNLYTSWSINKPKPIWDSNTESDESGSENLLEHHNAVAKRNHYVFADTCTDAWDLCDSANIIGILLGNGKTIRASKSLLEWFNPTHSVGQHVDLSFGTVGSALWLDDYDNPPSKETLERKYGKFLNCPVVLERAEVSKLLKKVEEPRNYFEKSEKSISARIIAASDQDSSLSKSEAERRFADGVSHKAFLRAWALAAEARPHLSLPGRKSRSNRDP